MQRFYGNADLGEGWELVGMTAKIDGARWNVLRREAHNESDWRMVKVAADGYAKAKANYWLSFDGKRFAGGSEYWKLVEHRFELAKAVIVLLGGEVGNLKPFDAAKAKPVKLNAKEADAYRKLLDGFTVGAPMTAKRPPPSKFGKLNKKRNACQLHPAKSFRITTETDANRRELRGQRDSNSWKLRNPRRPPRPPRRDDRPRAPRPPRRLPADAGCRVRPLLPPPRPRLIREALMLAAGAVLTVASVWFMLATLAALGAG